MRTRIPSLIALGTVLAETSCVETHTLPREDHCAQQTGNQWCAEQYPDGSRPFCGRGYCELDDQDPVALDGCLAERPAEDACYSPCGDGTTVLENASCLASEGSTGSTTTASTTDEPSTGGGTDDDPNPVCGNGLLEDGEACDDGELNGALGRCTDDCQGLAVGCGDGEVQDGEICDDGDAIDGNGCNTDCRPSGMVVWERQDVRYGVAYGVDVGADGAIYVAGQADGLVTAAWTGRLGDADGAVEWSYELLTPNGTLSDNLFYTVSAAGDDEVWVGGRHDDGGHLVRLDRDGGFVEALPVPAFSAVRHLAALPDGGLLVTNGWDASRIDGLIQEWQTEVGLSLAYRFGDDVALAAIYTDGAGFRRFTLHGDAFAPVMFPIPDGLSVESREVAWASDGDVIVAGRVYSGCCEEALVLKSSSGGQLRWMYGPQDLQEQHRLTYCLAVDSQDATIVGGYTSLLGKQRPFLMKLSAEGDVLWIRQLEFQATPAQIAGCTTTPTDEIVAVGTADGHFWFAKLTP